MTSMRWTAINLAADEILNVSISQMTPRPRSVVRKQVSEDEAMRAIRAEVRRLCDLVGYVAVIRSEADEDMTI